MVLEVAMENVVLAAVALHWGCETIECEIVPSHSGDEINYVIKS